MIFGHRNRQDRSRSRVGGAAFSPTQLSGCALWLRADLGITLNGGNVSAWANQGTLGGSVSQGTGANQPAYSAAGGPNSRPALQFDGGDSLASTLAASSWNFLHSATFTLFVVFRSTTNSTTHFGVLVATYSGSNATRGSAFWWENRIAFTHTAKIATSMGNASGALVYNSFSSNNSSPYNVHQVAEFVQENGASGNDLLQIINGSVVGGAEPVGSPSAGAANGTLTIGSLVNGTANFIGDISEVIAFNRTLSAAERSLVRRYLGAFYAVAVA